ncbi:MAG: urocanate hydratase, partial [Clostridia bacterium]
MKNIMLSVLPEKKPFIENIRRAPKRQSNLTQSDMVLAVKNALRYCPKEWHKELIPEFMEELQTRGRIYGYRFRPTGRIYGKPIDEYESNCIEGKAFQVMIDNNLDFEIALYPYELVTYGETGQVCQNWMQYLLLKKYLKELTDTQTLVVMSGHPLGLFESSKTSPRVVITNSLMIGCYDNQESWARAAALGVANYGQMTAGGWMYIGPQGIVHGTYNTILNAARLRHLQKSNDLSGVLFVSSGLGGMSGAQGKAVTILTGAGIIAEVDYSRIKTRLEQGWVSCIASSPKEAFELALKAKAEGYAIAVAFHGNIVDLLEYAIENNIHIDLLSDQTSCHAAYDGGYCPQHMSFEERTAMLYSDKKTFIERVNTTLKAHFNAIKKLTEKGTYFFDYGNSFMKSVFDAGVNEIAKNKKNTLDGFIFPSYVEDILGPVCFDYGYGPFRWVCLSGNPIDLHNTDLAAMNCIDKDRRFQDYDNYIW